MQNFQKGASSKMKSRENVKYFFRGLPICKPMYCFLHDINSKNRLDALQKIYGVQNCIAPRVHGLSGKVRVSNTITEDKKEFVVNFIKKYAEKYAMPLPGRLPNCWNSQCLKLPTKDTKSSVHRVYLASIGDDESMAISNRSFRDLWRKYVPYITTLKPMSDLCDVCRDNTYAIQKSANKSHEEKEAVLQKAVAHSQDASNQRAHYNECRSITGNNITNSIVKSIQFFQIF